MQTLKKKIKKKKTMKIDSSDNEDIAMAAMVRCLADL